MADTFMPTEAQIERVLEKTGSDPRKLAIAYLRAQKRVASAELAFGVMGDLNDATLSVVQGDAEGAKGALNKSIRRMKASREINAERGAT